MVVLFDAVSIVVCNLALNCVPFLQHAVLVNISVSFVYRNWDEVFYHCNAFRELYQNHQHLVVAILSHVRPMLPPMTEQEHHHGRKRKS